MSAYSSNNRIRTAHRWQNLPVNRGMAFGVIIITALFAFEIFNYSTTDFALTDLLGELRFAGLRWATILSIAFCGIDFAGIARLFTPETKDIPHHETWYLFGAWLLAATMNAMLTWWGVSLAILTHDTLGNAVLGRETLLRAVPVFVALLVWLIRVLIIGTFSIAGDRLFSMDADAQPRQIRQPPAKAYSRPASIVPASRNLNQRPATLHASGTRHTTASANNPNMRTAPRAPVPAPARTIRPTPPPQPEPPEMPYAPQEPTYQPLFSPTEFAESEIREPYSGKSPTGSKRF